MILSILILTTPRRRDNCFQDLLTELERQSENLPVEIIGIYDNKKRSVGDKRNAALSMAQGRYVTFIDDDDKIATSYISDILACIKANPTADVVVFDCITTIRENGVIKERHYSKYGKDFAYTITDTIDENGFKQWRGKPAHTNIWRSEIAKRHTFPGKNYSEDTDWVAKANADVKAEARINKVLYYYQFNSATSETRS
jgi:glycosyltransferase involved in cell wall biosynthesis